MERRIGAGGGDLVLTLRRTRAARRFSLRVSRIDGRVTLTMPLRASEGEALRFAEDQIGWIRGRLASLPPATGVGPGALVPILGVPRLVVPAAGRGIVLEEDRIAVPGPEAAMGRRVAAFLKVLARDRLAPACDRHAAALGRRHAGLRLRDTRSRWGSCSAAGELMFSWRLAMAPPAVLDYVAAHEVAHLVEMNHSPAFWAVVARLVPGHAGQRAWLRAHGERLQAIRFGP
ncbi:MAG: M48 family metallopeptidase [Rhodobacteraceae bacterium]|nr:M48 family metallopeptidase [Paracoccaceae bacterium]